MNDSETKMRFPQGFLLGAAAAAHQVEGNNTNSDWWYWEQQGKLAKSGEACDHYHRFEEDFRIAHDIGLNAMRISIEWARVEPEEGQWNAAAVEHYKKVLKSMKDNGLTRMVTLWHWTLPKWLADKGGFETKEGVEAFGRYAWFIAQNLGKEIDLWITLNEPENYINSSYVIGKHPPFVRSLWKAFFVTKNLIEAHKVAFKAIKQALGNVPVSIAKNNNYYKPYRKNNLADLIICFLAKKIANEYFLEKMQKHLDFIGLNFYLYNSLKFDWRHGFVEMNLNQTKGQMNLDDAANRSDMGWFLYPEGIYHVLLDLKKYHLPIYVTENGLADAADSRRQKYLQEIFEWLRKAIDDKVDLRGYLHWSLTDNYEWEHGFGPRFGLVEIDYVTQKRTIRSSAKIFKKISLS